KTQAGVVFGTPQYMSPEQGRGMPLDARSDLYALGVLAYEMVTGNVPYNDENPMTVIQMHLHGQVPPMPASIPYSVQNVVRGAMQQGGPMQQGPGGFQPASPMQKTIVAGLAPPMLGGQMMPQGTPGSGFPPQHQGMHGMPPQGGPNKTVMLQPSDGVVSMAAR